MKNRNITKWVYDDSKMRNLAIFANLIDELTFNYTTDSFKAPALNVMSMIRETYDVMVEIRKGVIYGGAFLSVYEELRMCIDKDPVFKDLLLNRNLLFLLDELNDQKNENRIFSALSILVTIDLNTSYYDVLKTKVITLIKDNSKQRNDLVACTRTLLTQLRNLGYTDDYIYYTNRRYFYYRDSRIENVNAIDEYFANFDGSNRTYKISFIGNPSFADLTGILIEKGITAKKDLEQREDPAYKRFLKYHSKNSMILSQRIEAKDAYAARHIAMRNINGVVRFFSFYHHKTVLNYRECSLVECVSTDESYTISKPIREIVKCKDLRRKPAAEMFEKYFTKVNFDEPSALRIENSLEQHKSALESDNIENQYINLFTALEVLIPKDPNADKQRINQIHNVLVPYLSIAYFRKLLESILKSLYLWNNTKIKAGLAKVTEGTFDYEKLAALLVLEKYGGDVNTSENPLPTLKRDLFSCNYHLMLNRLDFLANILRKHESILDFLKIHMKRIRWHIDRIYRTRNLIVHAGTTPVYMGTILENVHSYYDILVTQLFEDNIEFNFKDIQMSYNSCSLRLDAYIKYLTDHKDDHLKEDTFLKAIFFV